MTELPEELQELERRLRAVRFRPRESFEPELGARMQRGEPPASTPLLPRSRRFLVGAAVAILAGTSALGVASMLPGAVVTVDRCCHDLDGGGPADDGVIVVAERDSKVHRLRVYEDLDGSTSFTPGDLVRLDRGDKPAILESHVDGLITTRQCCLDLDGGGPDDDGLLVIGTPPDRVFMAAIYETGSKAAGPMFKGGGVLR